MKFLCQLSLVTALLTLVSCGVGNLDRDLAEERVEKYLKIDIPSNFEIVEYKSGGLIDVYEGLTIRIEKTQYDQILTQLDLREWTPMQDDDKILTKHFRISRRENAHLTLIIKKQMIGYNWSFD